MGLNNRTGWKNAEKEQLCRLGRIFKLHLMQTGFFSEVNNRVGPNTFIR